MSCSNRKEQASARERIAFGNSWDSESRRSSVTTDRNSGKDGEVVSSVLNKDGLQLEISSKY